MTAAFTLRDYDEAAQAILARTTHRPTVGLVLGSGLSDLADAVEDAVVVPYDEIPHFPLSTAPGHHSRLVIGRLAGMPVCVMQGRLHFYEGYSMQEVTLPVRVMRRMGVETLILTNAAGGLNPAFARGRPHAAGGPSLFSRHGGAQSAASAPTRTSSARASPRSIAPIRVNCANWRSAWPSSKDFPC